MQTIMLWVRLSTECRGATLCIVCLCRVFKYIFMTSPSLKQLILMTNPHHRHSPGVRMVSLQFYLSKFLITLVLSYCVGNCRIYNYNCCLTTQHRFDHSFMRFWLAMVAGTRVTPVLKLPPIPPPLLNVYDS